VDWQQRHRRVHQRLDAFAVNRADRENLVEAELGKFDQAGFRAARIHLVDRDQNGLAAAPQFYRDFAVERHNTFLHIDDEDDEHSPLRRPDPPVPSPP